MSNHKLILLVTFALVYKYVKMQLKLLGQGYESKSEFSVGNQLIKFLANEDFYSFTCITAFTSLAGVNGISSHIKNAKKHLASLMIVTGIDQKGTSKEALEALLSLGIGSYIFYQPSKTIFHPKIYLFEGKTKSELIIGSSNLTANGLFANVETSLLVSIDNSSDTDVGIIKELKEYFLGIFDHTDPNLKPISNDLIDELVVLKIVPTETERKSIHDKENLDNPSASIEAISNIFPKRVIAKIPKEFRLSQEETTDRSNGSGNKINLPKTLLWQSGPLTQRDLNIPKGSNTNPTGSMFFKKGLLQGIDQRHYFRDDIFSKLDWKYDTQPRTKHIERASANFQIIVDNKNEGTFNLTLTHNTKTDTAAYKQNNSMTSVSWGIAKKVIAKDYLIGKNAKLDRKSVV